MENDGFLVGIVFCKSLMAVGSAGHRYGGTRGASKTCRESNTIDHDIDAVASNTWISTRAAVVPTHERGHVRTVCCILGRGGCPVLPHCFQTFPTVTLLSHVGRHLRLSCHPQLPLHHPLPQNPCKFKAEWREKNIIHRFRRIPAEYPHNIQTIDLIIECDGSLLFVCSFIFGVSGCLRSCHSKVPRDHLLNNSTSHRHA